MSLKLAEVHSFYCATDLADVNRLNVASQSFRRAGLITQQYKTQGPKAVVHKRLQMLRVVGCLP